MNNMDDIKFLSSQIDNTKNRIKNLEIKKERLKKKRKRVYLPFVSGIFTVLFFTSGLNLGILLWILLGEATLYIRFKLQKEDLKDLEKKTDVEVKWLKKQLLADYNQLDLLVASKKKNKALSKSTEGNTTNQLRRLKSEIQLLKYQQTHPVKKEETLTKQEDEGYSYRKR